MSASLTLVIVMAVLYATGVYVILEHSLTRVLIGFLLIGNGTNILIFLMSGPNGSPPIITSVDDVGKIVDSMPQVLILTAIVINFGITAFLLALIYRSWWLTEVGDQVDDDEAHAADAADNSEDVFQQAHEDDEAIQHALEASDEDEEPQEATR